MGLDMYLYKKTYVKNWDHNGPEGQHQITVKKGNKKLKHVQPKRISEITEEVGYWRKANHIHQWFVREVQNGVDECQLAYVEKDKLKELRSICQTIVDYFDKSITGKKDIKASFGDDWTENIYDIDESVLSDLLPTASGFFFGGTDYDHWYYQDCKGTVEIIDDAFKGFDEKDYGISFAYESSW
jgi:hypothetical protein